MRDLILKMSTSVDGFVADLEGTNKWMFASSDGTGCADASQADKLEGLSERRGGAGLSGGVIA